MSTDKKSSTMSTSFSMTISATGPATFKINNPEPTNPELAFNEAQALVKDAKFAEAEELCRKILNTDPNFHRALHLLGFLSMQKGQPLAALDAFEKCAKLGSMNPLLFMHLGIARASCDNVEGSITALKQAITIEPSLALAHFNLGLSLKKSGAPVEAENALRSALAITPNHVDALFELGNLLAEKDGGLPESLDVYDRALGLNPEHIGALNQKALALQSLDRMSEAKALMLKVIAAAPDRPEFHINYGGCLLETDGEGAIAAYRKALEIDPYFPGARAHLAMALENLNRVEEARKQALLALESDPSSFLAHLTLAHCDIRDANFKEASAHIEALNMSELQAKEAVIIQKTKASLLNRQGKYAEAFAEAADANRRKLQIMALDPDDTKRIYEDIQTYQDWFTSARVSKWPHTVSSAYDDPIFFVGFPRSGTTLMEQILKVHPHLIAGGENDWLIKTLETLPKPYPESLDDLSEIDIERLRRHYWEMANEHLGERMSGKRLIDKMPLNILHLGFVRRIFPNAMVLVAIRDPRDCILSGFMQDFRRTAFMDQFLTLQSAAQFYCAVIGLWFHYRDTLGLRTFEYRYEELVQNSQAGMEQILSFLGEEWNDVVLNHQTNMRANETIATPSIRDVSQAIYTRSANRWLVYERELAPIANILQPCLVALGYEIKHGDR